MRRLLPLLVLLAIPFASSALADGCPPASCGITSSTRPGSNLVFVRTPGQQGPLQAFDVRTGRRRFTLPPGMLSANGATFLSSVMRPRRTTIMRYDLHTGGILSRGSLRGRWDAAAISADGRYHALTHYRRHGVVFRAAGRRAVLRGEFEVEALSPNGSRLYLIHWRRNGYDLQQLDLVANRLTATRLDEPDEKMSGTAVNAVATRDGHWLLTLYSKPNGQSFVHALDLRTGLAHCIDLTLVGDYFQLGSTVLSLSPNEATLYLANPYLGRVTSVDLARLEVTRMVRFPGLSPNTLNMLIGPSAASTPNGRMLAFTGQKSLWLYDTAFGVVRKAASFRSSVTGLGFRPDGRSLLVLLRRGSPAFLDAATGRRL